MLEGKKPYFLVGFDPSSSSDALEVPAKFRKLIEGLVPGVALLLGPSGNTWHVELARKNGDMFFQDGWAEFVQDHTLSRGDSLVFRHDADLHFTVLVFDGSSCEKESAFSSVCSQILRYSIPFVRKKKKREMDSSAASNEVVDGVLKRARSSLVRSESTNENPELQIVVADENEGQQREAGLLSGESEGRVGFTFCNLVTSAVPLAFHSAEATFVVGNSEEHGLLTAPEAERVASSFTSSLPNFTKVMKKFNISGSCTLNIPYQFATAHLPNCKVKIVLHNLKGESWTVNSVPGSGTRMQSCHTLCGGWLGFVRDNNINIGDFCIFELVQMCELRVHIIRVKRDDTENCCENEIIKAMMDKSWAKLKPKNTSGNSNHLQKQVYKKEQDLGKVKHDLRTSGSLSSPQRGCVSKKSVPEEKLAAARFLSSFPHFVKIMKKFNVSGSFTLNIPYKFAMDHLPGCKTEIVLRNLKGKSWTVNSIPTEKVRTIHTFCGGWMSFVRENDIQIGDICIFELIGKNEMRVHISQSGLDFQHGRPS